MIFFKMCFYLNSAFNIHVNITQIQVLYCIQQSSPCILTKKIFIWRLLALYSLRCLDFMVSKHKNLSGSEWTDITGAVYELTTSLFIHHHLHCWVRNTNPDSYSNNNRSIFVFTFLCQTTVNFNGCVRHEPSEPKSRYSTEVAESAVPL